MNSNIIEVIAFIGILVAVIILFFIVTLTNYHRRYVKLQKERVMNEITMLENERKRMANDLHDSMGPALSSIKLNINSIDTHTEEDRRIIEKAGNNIDELIKNMRIISYNLLPITLERKGLIEALKEFIAHVSVGNKLKIHLFFRNEVTIPKEKEIHIFRILQEIIHNTIKHSGAKNLNIGFGDDNGKLMIYTNDDGHGFDVNKLRDESHGFGLKSIESRADMLNAKMIIESNEQKGTTYFFTFG